MIRERAVQLLTSPRFRRSAAMLALAAAVGAAAPALAATKPAAKAKPPARPAACYNRAESAAEQTIRLHTEMMVVGLTCRTVMPEQAPFDKYQEFTTRNRTAISKAEGAMIEHFKRTGGGNATKKFDTYRTELANEISRRAATIGTNLYCATFVPRSVSAVQLTAEDLRTLTSDEKGAGLKYLTAKPLCDVKVVSTPDSGTMMASVEPSRSHAKPAAKAAAKPAAKPATARAKPAPKPKKQNVAALPR